MAFFSHHLIVFITTDTTHTYGMWNPVELYVTHIVTTKCDIDTKQRKKGVVVRDTYRLKFQSNVRNYNMHKVTARPCQK